MSVFRRLEPGSFPLSPGSDLVLEGLRGFAALMVLYAHLTAHAARVDPIHAPSPLWWRFEFATGAVLLFFVISGYVIGLTNRTPADGPAIRGFWWRRFWRLVPINTLAVAAAWVALPATSPSMLLGHLFFLQYTQPLAGLQVPLLAANPNLWSLHYEVVYYLLFPVVWSLRPRLALLFTGLLFVAALRLGWPGLALPANLAAGAFFWLAGLCLAWLLPPADDSAGGCAWPSVLLLFFVSCKLHVAEMASRYLGLSFPVLAEVNLWHLDLLPSAVLLVAVLTNRLPPRLGWWLAMAAAIPGVRLVWSVLAHGDWPVANIRLYAVCWGLALVLLPWRPSRRVWSWLAPVGGISYALYAFASPAQAWFQRQEWLPSGTESSYLLRLVLIVLVAGFLAWLAEGWLQPRILARLRRRPAA